MDCAVVLLPVKYFIQAGMRVCVDNALSLLCLWVGKPSTARAVKSVIFNDHQIYTERRKTLCASPCCHICHSNFVFTY